jgi:ketosteroid isomerase-like protein
MRHLVLLAALAFATACADTTSPVSGASAVEGTTAERRPDLREARASLIDAGNAVSSAIATEGVAAGLGDALTADALLLSPRKPTISGRETAVAFLTSDPLAPSALSWEVIAAEVSSDATQGYTWAHGRFTIDIGSGPLQRPGFFLAYWRRTESGRWRIAAFVMNQGSGPQPLPLPEGFGTPDSKHTRFYPRSEVAEVRSTLIETDAAFSQASVENGTGPAFERFAAPNALAVGGTFLFGPEQIGEAFASEPGDVVSWVPQYAGAAPSGDLGFTVGDAVFALTQLTFYTKYLTVWQRQKDGEWLFVADLGNSRPTPAP